jgi:hypothetical protein
MRDFLDTGITWLPLLPNLMPFDSFLGAYVKRDMNMSSEQVANIDELKGWDTAAMTTKAPEVMHAQTEISHAMKECTLKFTNKHFHRTFISVFHSV